MIYISSSKIQQISIPLTQFRQIVLNNLKDYTFKQNKTPKTGSMEGFRDFTHLIHVETYRVVLTLIISLKRVKKTESILLCLQYLLQPFSIRVKQLSLPDADIQK